jgi:transcriptional regulator with XRE-family HTH domain
MLRGCRYKKGITQLELAKALRVNQHHISEMENGKRPIGREMAKRLAEFFETNYRVFL